jgi:hypothetical protein
MATALALFAGACMSNGQPVATAQPPAGNLIPVAFESITGAPQPVFDRLVTEIGREAEARRILVVSRNDQAAYRVRGYLSADGADGRISWVFDVFDRSKRRALRLAGEEPTGRPGDPWSGANDIVIARLAATSLSGLGEFLAQQGQPGGALVAGAAAPQIAGFAP